MARTWKLVREVRSLSKPRYSWQSDGSSVISDDFGTKTAYFKAIAMKAAYLARKRANEGQQARTLQREQFETIQEMAAIHRQEIWQPVYSFVGAERQQEAFTSSREVCSRKS
jgi:hypothetical protein